MNAHEKKTDSAFKAPGVLVLAMCVAVFGCSRHSHLSEVKDALSIGDLKARPPFRAQVLDVHVEENFLVTNDKGHEVFFTNLYSISLRNANGKEEVISGVNEPSAVLDLVKRLEKGNFYSFPEAITK